MLTRSADLGLDCHTRPLGSLALTRFGIMVSSTHNSMRDTEMILLCTLLGIENIGWIALAYIRSEMDIFVRSTDDDEGLTEQQLDLVRVLWSEDDEPSDIVAAVHLYSKWCLATEAQVRQASSLEEYTRDVHPGVSTVCLNAMRRCLIDEIARRFWTEDFGVRRKL